jgi:hypothetical protein
VHGFCSKLRAQHRNTSLGPLVCGASKLIRAFTELQRGFSDPHTHTKRQQRGAAIKPTALGRYIMSRPLHARGAASACPLPPSPTPFSPPFFSSTRIHLEPLFPWLSWKESRIAGSVRSMQRGPCGAASRPSSPSVSSCLPSSLLSPRTSRSAHPDSTSSGTSGAAAERPLNHPPPLPSPPPSPPSRTPL